MSKDSIAVIAGVLPILVRTYYTARFRYRARIFQPHMYLSGKNFLAYVSSICIVASTAYLLVNNDWIAAIVTLAACALLQMSAVRLSYKRAVADVAEQLVTTPVERRRTIAKQMVDSDIEEGRIV